MKEDNERELVASIRDSYGAIAEHFAQTRTALWPELIEFTASVKPGERVLDAGCGNGRLYPAIIEKGAEYVGIDLVPELLKEAKQQYPEGNFQLGDLTRLAVAGEFNHIFMIAVLHHIPAALRLACLQQLYGKLQPGGKLYITVWNLFQTRMWHLTLPTLLHGSREVMVPWKNQQGSEMTKRRYYAFTKSELRSLLLRAGFKNVKIWYSTRGEQAHWWDGYNLCVTATRQ